MRYGSVIVETRPLGNLQDIILNHVKFLPDDWGLTVFCSEENKHLVQDGSVLGVVDSESLRVIVLEQPINEMEYNKLLTSQWFWDQLPYDKCLIFQHDSEIFRKWESKFEKYDYIGAPWSFQRHGGNGGLSWRSVAAMKAVLEIAQWHPSKGNEDVFFCNVLHGHPDYLMADRQTCSEFSVETIYQPATFGAHAIDKWLTPEQCKKLRSQ
jgi:hypothetical protein